MKKIQAVFTFALSCVMAFATFASSKLYMVIDLSAGANATTYPISYLDDVPSGGWTDEYKTTKLVLRRIEPGTCVVTVDKPYYIGVFEMTQKQYALVTGTNPSYFSGDTLPVERVSYDAIRGTNLGAKYPNSTDVDADSFMGKVRARTGKQFDLPSDYQWEYACRAGSKTIYYWGDSMDDNYAWYGSNSGSQTHEVGTKIPNVWGLYDMSGNVWEWCLEWCTSSARLVCSGSWDRDEGNCASAKNGYWYPSRENNIYGLRVVGNLNNSSLGGTITFNANGSTNEVETITIDVGESIVNLPVISRKGYVFLGWYTEKDGGELLCRGRELNGDITAYAHWVRESQIENVTEEKGGFVCVQYNSVFALYSMSNALDCLNNAAAWTGKPAAKRYPTMALGAATPSKKKSPFNQLPFPSFTNTTDESWYFTMTVTGTIVIPEPGKWSFDCGHDDGFRMLIQGNGASFSFEHVDGGEYAHTTATFDIPVAGKYHVSGVFVQHTYEAEFDFSVAKGAYSSFDSSVFKLVGDPASDVGVVVEPDAPEFDPASGTVFEPPLSVAISCPTEGATVHYTTDGTEPTEQSSVYKRFRISKKTTVKAIAIDETGNESDVAVAEYALGTCDDPMIAPMGGTVFQHSDQKVSISCGEEGTLRFTLDGTEPTTNSPAYAGPFTISESTVVKAKVFSEHYFDSQVVTANLTREWVKVETPTNTLRVANSGLSVYVDLGCADQEAELHYTLDGTDPTAESPIYTKPFYAFDADTLKVVAVRNDYANSTIVTNDLAIYCVVDLSEGASALIYPVSYRVGVPEGGWTDEYKTIKLVLRKINAGTCSNVTIANPYYVGVFEMTQKQYALVTGEAPSYFTGDELPVEKVSYSEIRGGNKGAQYPNVVAVDDDSFMGKLCARTGLRIDLPSEAQWEYACRAGTTTAYSYGDDPDGDYMWYASNSESSTHNVGTRLPNPWGLYDTHGNIGEWCLEWCSDGDYRLVRGGDWWHDAGYCTSTSGDRGGYSSGKNNRCGFRLCRTMDTPQAPSITPDNGSTFDSVLSVSITSDCDGVTIHYTTNGLTPTLESPVYKRFRIFGKTTVKAIAFYEDGTSSEMAVAEYARGTCDDPVISPADGTVFQHENQEVCITCGTEGTLRYTLDGSEPTTNSSIYGGPFTISESTVVKAKVFSEHYFDSKVVTANLTREWVTVETPVITAGATFTGTREVVTITCATVGAAIHYTLDGSEPTRDSPLYRGAFNVKESCSIKAIALLNDFLDSAVVDAAVTHVNGIGDVLGVPDVAFTCSGAADWMEDTATVGAMSGTSMKSGKITHSQESVLTATVTGKGTLSFYLKTSCEDSEGWYDWDRLEFTADNQILPFDGEHGWTNVVLTFTTEGPHTLTWTYVKDYAGGDGDDCAWLSNVSWTRTDLDPLPELGVESTPAEVDDALEGVADARLRARIVVGSDYVRFRSWANATVGDAFSQHAAVKTSPYAWLSYALDSDKLLTKEPEQGDVKIAAFEKNMERGFFDIAVEIDGVTVGASATAENLSALLGVDGCSTVDGTYSTDSLSFTFGIPVDGKVTISASPKDESATQFFLKVKMTP